MKKLILLAALLLSPLSMLSQNATIEHPWKGARVAFIGDSITDPGAVPDNHDWTGRDDIHYWGYLQKWLGIRPFVYGVSGRQWNDVVNQAEQLR